MELPQLKLYLRRVLAMPPGLPWHEALRTARVRALLALLGWTVLSTITLLVVGYSYSVRDYQVADALNGGGMQLLVVGCTLAGVWYLLFVTAEQMSGLAREGKSSAPQWYAAPLPSASAVVSTLLSALCAALPAVVGLGLYLVFIQQIASFNDNIAKLQVGQSGLTLSGVSLAGLGWLLLHLPAFALFAGSLSLALRQHRWGPYVPPLVALVGTMSTQLLQSIDAKSIGPPDWTLYWVWLGWAVLGLLTTALVAIARQNTSGLASTVGLILFVGAPALATGLTLTNCYFDQNTCTGLIRRTGSSFYPAAQVQFAQPTILERLDLAEQWPVVNYALMSLAYPLPDGNVLGADPNTLDSISVRDAADAIAMSVTELVDDINLGNFLVVNLMTLICWWWCCIAALNAARNIRHRPAAAQARRRGSGGAARPVSA